jgi:N-acetylneuraminate synthase
MIPSIKIGGREIGTGRSVYIVAEMSANHQHNFGKAVKIIEEAKEAGADAVKIQTYTPDTMTIDSCNEYFQIKGTIWEGKNLYDLYGEAYTPWHWQEKLKEIANKVGLDFFSTPFDPNAVDFLEQLNLPAYKLASFELVDLPLIKHIAMTGKPVIMSTGMASLAEIDEAVRTFRGSDGSQLALLKCTSAYPAPPEEMNLRAIPHLAQAFGVPVGLSDHTLGPEIAIAAVALGACIVEKHFTLSREIPGPDSAFSAEPREFKQMVEAIRNVEKALGGAQYQVTKHEQSSKIFRRSLFVVRDMRAGETFTEDNVRSIRPGFGLHTRHLREVIGHTAKRDVSKGTPLSWDLIE